MRVLLMLTKFVFDVLEIESIFASNLKTKKKAELLYSAAHCFSCPTGHLTEIITSADDSYRKVQL